MAAGVESRIDSGPLGGVRRASFGQCGMDFATTTMGSAAFRRLSNAADRAAEARARLSAQFELSPISALPVKRLSEELAAVLKKRDSWSASVSPLPLTMQSPAHVDAVQGQLDRSLCDTASCSPKCETVVASGASRPPSFTIKEPGPTQAQHQEQHQRHAPWYSLLSCRLLSFIGGGPGGTHGDEEYTASGARPVLSSHRLNLDGRRSIEHRLSESSIRSIRSLSLDGSGSEFCFSRDSLSGPRLAAGRRRAHEFSREDAYARDTSFYSEMAGPSATRISGVSTSSARGPLGDNVESVEAQEEEFDKATFRRRRDAYQEAWRRSGSKDTRSVDGPATSSAASGGVPPRAAATRPAMPRVESTDFANEELMRRNDVFCGRV